jgi:hypothetical protein
MKRKKEMDNVPNYLILLCLIKDTARPFTEGQILYPLRRDFNVDLGKKVRRSAILSHELKT